MQEHAARAVLHAQCLTEPDSNHACRGAWNLGGNRFMQPASMRSFAVASFADERRCGRGMNDPTSIQARPLAQPACSDPSWHMISADLGSFLLPRKLLLTDDIQPAFACLLASRRFISN